MGGGGRVLYVFLAAFCFKLAQHAFVSCALTSELQSKIAKANQEGPYLGLIIPNSFELDPLLQNPGYTPGDTIIDFAGRRFRFGAIGDKPVILVMTGLSVINAAITTQLLLGLFTVEGVVHYGIAGNANPSLHIGDVAIPKHWAHLALWSWQRYGLGPDDTLPLEDNGDYRRDIGYLKFADFTSNCDNKETVINVVNVQDLELESCINSTTCLTTTPKVKFVKRGISQSIYLDNSAYRTFIYDKFEVSPVDMESASVALICLQQRVPFIAFRALSDLAGGGSAESNEADTFLSIAATNSVTVVIEFVKLLSLHSKWWSM
ncbi:unnamed protein product [Sphenostylis stenocarpa]|uniref:Nucleoside phosphorylase domain-containing protein n=1 Tax=Sphenostylis stenocarpa TaxID=92480 RepID=A0AA86VQ93_9FABA|nr:unnamed protein product [Sphenostylis stenocarpa]